MTAYFHVCKITVTVLCLCLQYFLMFTVIFHVYSIFSCLQYFSMFTVFFHVYSIYSCKLLLMSIQSVKLFILAAVFYYITVSLKNNRLLCYSLLLDNSFLKKRHLVIKSNTNLFTESFVSTSFRQKLFNKTLLKKNLNKLRQ